MSNDVEGIQRLASWATRRRFLLRKRTRHEKRGSTFWCRWLTLLHTVAPPGRHKSWPDASTSESGRSSIQVACLSDNLPAPPVASHVPLKGLATCDEPCSFPVLPEPAMENSQDFGWDPLPDALAGKEGASCQVACGTGHRKTFSVSLGSDCCGLCTVFHALTMRGYQVLFEFASDISRNAKVLAFEKCPPRVWHDDVTHRDHSALPSVDVYSAGFPCQPFSVAGGRLGLKDPRGNVFFSCAAYIDAKRPKSFLLENVVGLVAHRSGETFDLVLRTLASIGGGCYRVQHRILNAEDSQIPQHRPRVYIIGVLQCLSPQCFEFPAVLPHAKASDFLDAPDPTIDGVPPTTHAAKANLDNAIAQLEAKGCGPRKQCFIIDIDASERFRSTMLERCPCLLKSRPRGYFVTVRWRRLTLRERQRLQGFPPFSSRYLSSAAMSSMLGNSMTLTVVARISDSLLPAIGIVANQFSNSPSPSADMPLQTGHFSLLLRCFCTTVLASETPFGKFVKAFSDGTFPVFSSRSRDVLPLPPAVAGDLLQWEPVVDNALGLSLLNLVAAGLNFMFLDGVAAPLPCKSTCLHRHVFHRISVFLDQAFEELGCAEFAQSIQGSFERLTSTSCSSKYPSLRAGDVDLLPSSGALDPSDALDDAGRAVLNDPDLLFPGGVSHLPAARASRETNHGDQVTLTINAVRSGKLSFALHPRASADVFVVGKRDSKKLREVWNGSLLSRASRKPPKPPCQACPASLATLECTDDSPFTVNCRDGRAFFDQIQLPAQLRTFFGRPAICCAHLMDPPLCESGCASAVPMTLDEINKYVIDGVISSSALMLTPVCNTYPMGFAWSSYVAQSKMVSSVLNAGFKEDQLLHDEHLILPDCHEAVAVATDDIHLFVRRSEPDAVVQQKPLTVLDAEWDRLGLIGHPAKQIDNAVTARVLGLELKEGKRFQSRGPKIISLIQASIDLCSQPVCTPKDMSMLNGHLQWQNLINRPLFSCLDEMYQFVHLQPETMPRPINPNVLSEVLLNVSMFCYWTADLCRPWLPILPCSDASPSYGFGASVAKCSPSIVRAVAAACADPSHIIRMTREPQDPPELPREGNEYRLPLTMSSFRDLFSVRASLQTHSGAMELQAVRMLLLRLARSSRVHSHRAAILVDAQAVCGALGKGRSSSATLKRGVKAVGAIALACNLKLCFPYVASESNPSDYPSRNKVRKRTLKCHRRPQRHCTLELLERAYRRAVRRWRDTGTEEMNLH